MRGRLGCFLTGVVLAALLILVGHWLSRRLNPRSLETPAPPLQQAGSGAVGTAGGRVAGRRPHGDNEGRYYHDRTSHTGPAAPGRRH